MSAASRVMPWLRSSCIRLAKLRVVGQCHAAFAGGDDLDRVEAEYGDVAVTTVADRFAAVFAANGVRGIFDDLEAVLLAKCVDACHVAGLSAQMHGDHDLG